MTVRTSAARALCALALTLAACAPPAARTPAPRPIVYQPVSPALPPIPRVEAPLQIRVVHPSPGSTKPRVDSTFIFGSVGTGGAGLAINGTPVAVAPNGAFLAYLPVPESGAWELTAAKGRQRDTATVAYRVPQPGGTPPAARDAGAVPEGVLASPRAGTVTGGADTLATGSDAVPGRPTPTGTYQWFFPRGARLTVLERRGEQYRVRLDSATTAWVSAGAVTLGDAPPATPVVGAARVRRTGGAPELVVPARGAPFRVEVEGSTVRLTVHGVLPGTLPAAVPTGDDPFVRSVVPAAVGPDVVRYDVSLARAPWGYRAWYDAGGDLVLSLRPPPAIDPADPLRGRRIVVDPGHPPAGATGPTGLTEAEANLEIGLRLAELLRARGAEVVMTRTENVPVSLSERVETAVRSDAEILVSVHNNAFGEGVNPFRSHHTATYYFHPFSAELAQSLNREIVGVTRIPDKGARQGNLALVRPTWMPTALTESLFMMIPEQEAALRDPAFLDRLAEAHARGIEGFFRERAGR